MFRIIAMSSIAVALTACQGSTSQSKMDSSDASDAPIENASSVSIDSVQFLIGNYKIANATNSSAHGNDIATWLITSGTATISPKSAALQNTHPGDDNPDALSIELDGNGYEKDRLDLQNTDIVISFICGEGADTFLSTRGQYAVVLSAFSLTATTTLIKKDSHEVCGVEEVSLVKSQDGTVTYRRKVSGINSYDKVWTLVPQK